MRRGGSVYDISRISTAERIHNKDHNASYSFFVIIPSRHQQELQKILSLAVVFKGNWSGVKPCSLNGAYLQFDLEDWSHSKRTVYGRERESPSTERWAFVSVNLWKFMSDGSWSIAGTDGEIFMESIRIPNNKRGLNKWGNTLPKRAESFRLCLMNARNEFGCIDVRTHNIINYTTRWLPSLTYMETLYHSEQESVFMIHYFFLW